MATGTSSTTFELENGETNRSGSSGRFQALRRLPRSYIIAAVLFYCASLLTVGLMAGLIPKRTQYVTVVVTVSPPVSTTEILPSSETPSISSSSSTSIASSTTTTTTTITFPPTTTHPSDCQEDECFPRLKSDLIIQSYQIEYQYTSSEQTAIPGTVTIDFTLKQPIKQLIYHAKRMVKLEEPALFENNVNRLVTMRTYAPNDYVTLKLTSDTRFPPNQYRLIQNFVVNVTDGNTGFYQSFFQDEDGSMKRVLSTQFQPTDARKAFPCFDEPQLKSVFKLIITHPNDTIAIANFPIMQESPVGDLLETQFEDTFQMSTYLAAWAILPKNYGQKSDDPDEPFLTTWARPATIKRDQTALALEIASNTIDFFKDYFATDAAVPPKIDLLSVPEFDFGAMENWGLITFREKFLIYDGKFVATSQKHDVGEVVAHELAHYWFGNYVTCPWWSDLWLNEAMATWLSYKPFIDKYPQWKLESKSLTENVVPVMWDDAKVSSHPILVKNVTDAETISSLFDSITYSKGASILRMLENTVGSNRFRDALREYLAINAFSVGDPNVFYDKLFDDISGADFMKNWLEEPNFPLVTVNLSVSNGNTNVVFTQSRFLISSVLNSSALNSTYRWQIQLRCVLGGDPSGSDTSNIGGDELVFLFDNEQTTKTITGKTYSWIKCNRDFGGFYATDYRFSGAIWQRFSNVIEGQTDFFTDADKTNLLHDAFLLAYRGLIDYAEPLRIVRSLIRTTMQQYTQWKIFQWHIENLASLLDYRSSTNVIFQNFVRTQILTGTTTLNSILTINPTDSDEVKLVKSLQYDLLCRMNHSEALQQASTLFRSIPVEYFNNADVSINVPADFLTTVYFYHLQNDDNDADWNMMYRYYTIAVSPQEQTRALMAISATKNRTRLIQLLNDGLTSGNNKIRRQDYFQMIAHMSTNAIGRDTAWTFFRQNYPKLVDIFTLENHLFTSAILSITHSFESSVYIQEMSDFFAQYPNAGSGTLARQQSLDQVKTNIEWIRTRETSLVTAISSISND